MKTRKLIAFIFCTAISIGLSILFAFQYIDMPDRILLFIAAVAICTLAFQTILNIYATTGKSLGLLWAIRGYGTTVLFAALTSILLICCKFIFEYSSILTYVFAILSIYASVLMVVMLFLQAYEIQLSFKK